MKDFEYFAPKTVAASLSLLSQYKGEAKIIAGGQSMLVVMRQGLLAPEYVVDIKGISALDYLTYDEREGLKIGALTTHRTIEKSPVVLKYFKVLSEMERNLATIQTRNWGTIGGNLCHGDPAGDPAPVLMVLNAKLKLIRQGQERIVAMEAFSKDILEVDLEPDEMLSEIQIPNPKPHMGTGHEKLMVMQGDAGIVGAAVSITLRPGDGICEDARIALSNAASIPLRAKDAERRLVGKTISPALLDEVCQIASQVADPPSDVHGSAEYRREMVKVFVRRATIKALERAKGGRS
jgi:carbon-monoxide dehydrogenase medium subunit